MFRDSRPLGTWKREEREFSSLPEKRPTFKMGEGLQDTL
jgi:hypothetical protein